MINSFCFYMMTFQLKGDMSWVFQLLGRLHPLIVHFPLTLIIFAALLEVFSIRNFHSKWRNTISIMLLVGCASALLSSLFGYLLKTHDSFSGDGINLHQNLGLLTSFLSLACLVQYQALLNSTNKIRLI